jgi:hypothetical protein
MLKWFILLGAAGGAIYALTRSKSALEGLLPKAGPSWQTCPGGTAFYYSEYAADDKTNAAVASASCTPHPSNAAMICCKG